jgi:peptidoglycan/xylan/chitin deacetylase (PgdA/CDA1 family)
VTTVFGVDEELAAQLGQMAAEDQRIRTRARGDGRTFALCLDPETAAELERVDASNAKRLRAILDRHGWPGRSLVGEQGSQDAWLVAQHTDHHPEVQRMALELLAAAIDHGEASARDLAYLTDRVRVNEGREQLYGTQILAVEDGVAIPRPIEDRANVDRRRAEVGLQPLDQYTREFGNHFRKD